MSYRRKKYPDHVKNGIVGGTLYLVATPIGNLSDISERALMVLGNVDFIAAEDTRNTGSLLTKYGISKEITSYYEYNKKEKGIYITDRLTAGESCALVTDAGTPAISDPGEDLVRLCRERGITVTSVPGPCAAISALILSGLPTGRFVFEGFISTAKSERIQRLKELSLEERTIIVHEAPHKLKETLADLLEYFGDRNVTLCRELTKLNEEILPFTLREANAYYETVIPKGEFIIVIEGRKEDMENAYPDDPAEHVRMLTESGMKRMDAIKEAARLRGVPKSEIYKAVIGYEDGGEK